MIIEHDGNGKIFHIVSDPVPEGLAKVMREHGKTFLDIPPTQLDHGYESAEADFPTHYVKDGELCRRPGSYATVKVVGRTVHISGLREGDAVRVDEHGIVSDGTSLEIEVDEPGIVSVSITPEWPHKESSHEIQII